MKRVCTLILLVTVLVNSGVVEAQAPSTITYQGFLADKAGNPLSGSYNLVFKIYKASTGGTEVWKESHGLTVTKGYLEVVLGLTNSLATVFDGTTLWLGVTVGSDSEMTPRKRLTAVPYSLSSGSAKICESLKGPISQLDVVGTFRATAYNNQSEDVYGTWQGVSIGDKDTCDGKITSPYTCPTSASKACVDIDSSSKKRTVTCKAGSRGVVVDSSGAVTVGNTVSPGKLTVNGKITATSILGDGSGITGIKSTPASVPVGVIVAWAKNLSGVPGLPANYVECNGQTLSDISSPLNGKVIPDLNGKASGKGSLLSGSTGSGGTNLHTHDYTDYWAGGTNPHTMTTHTKVANRSEYQVVWIMRIK